MIMNLKQKKMIVGTGGISFVSLLFWNTRITPHPNLDLATSTKI